MAGLPRSDLELAASVRGMSEAAGSPFIYGKQTDNWYVWDEREGRYAPQQVTFADRMSQSLASWLKQAFDTVWDCVLEVIAGLAADRDRMMKRAAESWKTHRAFVARIWNQQGQAAVQKQLTQAFSVDMSEVDAGTGSIVVDNGVIDYSQVLRDGYVKLRPHDSGAMITRRTGKSVAWDPDAACPVFERFLRESMPDGPQRFWLLWRVAGALFGLQRRKGFLNLIGRRDSGKSTFTDLIAYIAGDYARPVPVETFLAKHAGDAGFRQHDLMAARFVYTHEPNAGALYDVSFMKQLTGRDAQRTAGKYEKPITWKPQCTPFIGSNNPIRFNTADDAMMSRQEAVLFQAGYDVPDLDLLERLKSERNGILRLLLDTVAWEARNGLPELPLSVIELRERMAVDTEDALRFVSEYIADGLLAEVGGDHPVYKCAERGKLWEAYRVHWCDSEGVQPVKRKTFNEIIGRKYPMEHSGVRVFRGLACTDRWRVLPDVRPV
jgi:P4 family phage/plasmid primase-like protien